MKGALGLIETIGLATAIVAADAAVKSANVTLIGYENTKGNGKITVKFSGNVGAVKAAVAAGSAAATRVGKVYGKQVIARPHDGIDSLVNTVDRGNKPAELVAEKELVEETAVSPSTAETEEATDPEPKQCIAITKSGNRCKRNAVAGSDYCSMHQPEA